MKIKLSFLVMAMLISVAAMSQNLRLNVYTNYVFDDAVDSRYDANNYYDGKVNGGFQWGAGLEYMASPSKGIELSYLRQDTKAPMTYATGIGTVKNDVFDVGINWIMLGGNHYMRKPGGMVEGFGGMSIGVAFANVENTRTKTSNNGTKFAWGIKGGANIWVSPQVALKLQAQLYSAVQGAGGGLYFGTGGAGAGVSTYSSMYQFGLGGGLVFKFGGAAAKK
jgi:hypothetical protein